MRELVVDNFAGGGGASTGIEMALGRSPDYAVNHDPIALAMHSANHPTTVHLCKNVWKVIPSDVSQGRKIGLGWFSPDCKDHSKAKGGRPINKNIRDLGWVVIAYAKLPLSERPRVIILENVEEWEEWGPVVNGRRCPDRKGQTFKRWVRELRRREYKVEWRRLRGRDYGTPTNRKRLFVIARNDGLPIVWPKATHGAPDSLPVRAGKLLPWRTAAGDVIDWSIPCPSIFATAAEIKAELGLNAVRPLAAASMARLAAGIHRHVLNNPKPFTVPLTHGRDGFRGPPADQNAVAAAYLAQHNTGMVGHNADEPLSTIVGKGCTQAVVSAGLINMHGADRRLSSVTEPTPTQTAGGTHQAEARAFLVNYYSSGGQHAPMDAPCPTVVSKPRTGIVEAVTAIPPLSAAQLERAREVARFLRAHGYWNDREFVTIGPWLMIDVGMRMLAPRELFRAQGFPDSYVIDRGLFEDVGGRQEWRPITKTDQTRMCGNSVNPQVAEALVRANYAPMEITDADWPAFALQAAE